MIVSGDYDGNIVFYKLSEDYVKRVNNKNEKKGMKRVKMESGELEY